VIQIPGYLIKREIGAGGMATVYLAVQASLEREVALKVMNPALVSDPNFSRRFLQEARTLASLSHPNIVAVYDVGVSESQLHYFSMQNLPGGDLARRVRQGLAEREIVRVLRGVGGALGFAHARGFVHRDVSPTNVMFDANDNPILTDFGIARAVTRTSRLTNAGVSVGTSHYMSPEQARGGDVDARSDIYSLGAVAYEALTGKPPYDGEDGFAIAYAHVFEPVPRLPVALSRWQGLVDRALAKDPRDRYADLEAFLSELELVADGVAQPTRGATTAQREAVAPEALPRPVARDPDQDATPTGIRVMPETVRAATLQVEAPRRGIPVWVWPVGAAAVVLVGLGVWLGLRDRPVPPRIVAAVPATTIPESAPPTTATAAAAPAPVESPGTAAAQAGDPLAEPLAEDASATGESELPPDDARELARAVATTAVDPIYLLLALGKSDVDGDRLTQPPGRNALERYRLAAKLAEHFTATQDLERANAGIVATAAKYLELAERALAAGKVAEFNDYLARGQEIAASLPQGAEVAAQAQARRNALVEAALADGKRAVAAWDSAAAQAAYQRALEFDPASQAARKGLAEAQRVGKVGYTFRDTLKGGAGGPELVVVDAGGTRLAVARAETTLGEFRAYWSAEGSRGGERPACRDRESFFRSSRKTSFESPDFAQTPEHPVVCVTFGDAEGYARWLSRATGRRYRLPSAAEWTAFARGAAAAAPCRANLADASFRTRYGGRDATTCDDGHAETAPVRRFDAAPAGVYDIAGNVREWVGDCAPGCRQHLAMGSAWSSGAGEADPLQRESFGAELALNTVGFRVVRELD
jgi:hypothetical protein